MADSTIERINQTNKEFSSLILKDYYEVIRELTTILIMLKGYKFYGENAHKYQIDFLKEEFRISQKEINLMQEIRMLRNKISYDGFFINKEYLERKEIKILAIIEKLKRLIISST